MSGVEVNRGSGTRSAERVQARATETGSPATLGESLREARIERGLSLRALARELEVSPSLVSQIETGRIQPSVRTLYAIVSKLEVSLDELFRLGEAAPAPSNGSGRGRLPEDQAVPVGARSPFVLRADERAAIELETNVRWERLTAHKVPGVEFLRAVYSPGSESAPVDAMVRHTGRELGYVLSGRLGVMVGFEAFVLGPGDSVSFESTIPHRLHNDGDVDATALWVVLGRQPEPA